MSFRSLALALAIGLSSSLSFADEYSVATDPPLLGSMIPRSRATLGIKVDVNKSWDQLDEAERKAWREFTELEDPHVTPPFPVPNIRAFLVKLRTPEKYSVTDEIIRRDCIMLIAHVTENGDIPNVDIQTGTSGGSEKLSPSETLLAAVYANALMTTKFTPAKFNGAAAASAFPMPVCQVTKMK